MAIIESLVMLHTFWNCVQTSKASRMPFTKLPSIRTRLFFRRQWRACVTLKKLEWFWKSARALQLRISALMRVSGVRFGVYWTSSFTVDYAWYSTVALTLVVSLKAFGVDAVANTGATIALVSRRYLPEHSNYTFSIVALVSCPKVSGNFRKYPETCWLFVCFSFLFFGLWRCASSFFGFWTKPI